jgi:hypothetical protein
VNLKADGFLCGDKEPISMNSVENNEVRLNDIAFLALDHGMGSIAEGCGSLIPFAVTENAAGERTLDRFVTERIEQGVDRAKQFVDESKDKIERYAFAWDGFVTIEGRKWDAILVEAGDRHQETGYLMCQRYEKKGLLRKKYVPVGNPAMIGKPPSRIKE